MKQIFALLFLCLSVTACGFTPIYQDNSVESAAPVKSALNTVDIAIIPDYEGQTVRNHLIDRMYKNGYPSNPQYRLVTSRVNEQTIEIGIDRDDNASRAQLRQEASFRLIRLSDNAIVLERDVRATTGYNILGSQFATYITEEDARKQALRTLSDKIIIQLELFFNRNGAKG